jgi:hypothetical protein
MLLERRTVSRKTPNDGKLEISRVTADAVSPLGPRLTVAWQGSDAPAAVVTLVCTCPKGAGQHQHLFLESALFRTLEPGSEVDLKLEEGTDRVSVTPAR